MLHNKNHARSNFNLTKKKQKLIKKGDIILCINPDYIFVKVYAIVNSKIHNQGCVGVNINGEDFWQPFGNVIKKLHPSAAPELFL